MVFPGKSSVMPVARRRWGMADRDVSMTTCIEVTKKYATAYVTPTKKQRAAILDTVVEITGWNRDHARQQLRRRATQPPGRAATTVAVLDRRKTKPRKYSYDAMVVLRRIWAPARCRGRASRCRCWRRSGSRFCRWSQNSAVSAAGIAAGVFPSFRSMPSGVTVSCPRRSMTILFKGWAQSSRISLTTRVDRVTWRCSMQLRSSSIRCPWGDHRRAVGRAERRVDSRGAVGGWWLSQRTHIEYNI